MQGAILPWFLKLNIVYKEQFVEWQMLQAVQVSKVRADDANTGANCSDGLERPPGARRGSR